jgi:uncharacterized protein
VHEGEAVPRALRATGITVLENEALCLAARGQPLWLAGLADATTRRPDVGAALDGIPAGEAVIVLSHDPDLFPRVPARVALTLAGHTHGGQIALPGLRRWAIPSRFGERFARGHIVEGGRHLVVTSGVGTSRWPVRFRVPPEALLLTLFADSNCQAEG